MNEIQTSSTPQCLNHLGHNQVSASYLMDRCLNHLDHDRDSVSHSADAFQVFESVRLRPRFGFSLSRSEMSCVSLAKQYPKPIKSLVVVCFK